MSLRCSCAIITYSSHARQKVTDSIPRINFAVKEQTWRMVYPSRSLMPLVQINILAAENTISKTLPTNWIFLKTPVMFEINYSSRS